MAACMGYWQRRFFFFLSSTRHRSKCHIYRRYLNTRTRRSIEIDISPQNKMLIEIGSMARFADGSVVAKCGDTAVLVAVTSKSDTNSSAQFLPLTVDYRQKYAAAGRIPTNHLRRELGPSDKEILTSRVIDRSLRTRFPSDYFFETQITCNMLSIDGVNDPDIASINAASAALCISDIPWNGPVGAVRVGLLKGKLGNGRFVINPSRKEQSESDLNLVIATDVDDNVVMLEGEANNIPYREFTDAVHYGAQHATHIAKQFQKFLNGNVYKRKYFQPSQLPEEMFKDIELKASESINEILNTASHDKISRDRSLQNTRFKVIENLSNKYQSKEEVQELHLVYNAVVKKLIREQIIFQGVRCDGRLKENLRNISCEVDLYPPLHGSALFQRGQTQVLSTVAFDSKYRGFKSDPISVLTGDTKEKNFMLHYEFPSYAVNELKAGGSKNRRELGHGALAEKGLRAIIPEEFPFCIRLTCEVLESNGSSSMASICGGSLALMDAGVNIKEPAAGIAIGLVTNEESDPKEYHLLADISGFEDFYGEMDMKIGGTVSGLTAIQMDLKNSGIPLDTVCEAVDLAKKKISHIISIMKKQSKLEAPRNTMKKCRPVIEKLTVTPTQARSFAGVGGINFKRLQSETGVLIQNVDDNTYEIFAPNKDAMDEAMLMIDDILESKKAPELEFSAVYEALITEIKDFGVMVQLHPAMEPVLLHNSQLDHRRVSHPSALGLEVGQKISVKYFGRDPTTGAVRLSKKVLTAPSARTYKFIKDES
ncbi:polyribonucleotide nucleotidyltransferase 1, mitochondrial-like [Ruditapes philippinarum]|uniref:polyribonucleotide nucleotidyltransferase 1, mitochondrial-like n=1 Tax=Ruditapes philippinarum TaxID=129788 RepID=UPI00295AE378|nr:polyribonucleotide nucleotidyltransferase 1, mitochondrial-like [Ruditapes philippinarum]